jgi:isocitrate dehydrogenase (NAD+)
MSAIEMLKYIGENSYAEKIEKALFKTLADGNKTADIGGKLSTTEFTDVVISNL